jgi:hypothetical protein
MLVFAVDTGKFIVEEFSDIVERLLDVDRMEDPTKGRLLQTITNMSLWSAGDDDSKDVWVLANSVSYQLQYFDLSIVSVALIQAIDKKDWSCRIFERFARLNDQPM